MVELFASQHIQRYFSYTCDGSVMYAYITRLRLTTKFIVLSAFVLERNENMVIVDASGTSISDSVLTRFQLRSHVVLSKLCTFILGYRTMLAPCGCLDGYVREPYEMSMAFGARSYVQFLLQSACTSMCRHIYDWNIVDCDVKPIHLTF